MPKQKRTENNESTAKIRGKEYIYFDPPFAGAKLFIRERRFGVTYVMKISATQQEISSADYTPDGRGIIWQGKRDNRTQLREFLEKAFADYKAAEEKALQEQTERESRQQNTPAMKWMDRTFLDFLREHTLKSKEDELNRGRGKMTIQTIDGYKSHLRSFELFLVERGYHGVLLKNVDPSLIDEFNMWLKTDRVIEYNGKTEKRKGVKTQTVRRHMDIIRQGIEQAERWRILDRVWENIDSRNFSKDNYDEEEIPDDLSEDELKQLFDMTKDHPLRYVVRLAYALGLNRSEVLGLRWSQIDLESEIKEVFLKGTAMRYKGEFIISDKNKNKYRGGVWYMLDERTVAVLRQAKAKQAEYRAMFGNGYSTEHEDLVCVDEFGVLFHSDRLSRNVRKMGKKINPSKKIVFHSLRHTVGTMLGDNDRMSKYMRHADKKMRERYFHGRTILSDSAVLTDIVDITQ